MVHINKSHPMEGGFSRVALYTYQTHIRVADLLSDTDGRTMPK